MITRIDNTDRIQIDFTSTDVVLEFNGKKCTVCDLLTFYDEIHQAITKSSSESAGIIRRQEEIKIIEQNFQTILNRVMARK